MRPVRRHQGDSSQEDALTHHCPGLFCKGWSSMNNAVPVASSHMANSSSSLRRGAGRGCDRNKFLIHEKRNVLFVFASAGIDSSIQFKLSHLLYLLQLTFQSIACIFSLFFTGRVGKQHASFFALSQVPKNNDEPPKCLPTMFFINHHYLGDMVLKIENWWG